MSTRQTLKDYLVSIGKASVNTISYASDKSNGDKNALDEGDDLGIDPNTDLPLIDFGKNDSLTSGYASFVTKVNEYSLTDNSKEASHSRRGDEIENAESQGAESVFANESDLFQKNYFEDSGTVLDETIDKLGNNLEKSGPALIKSVMPDASYSDIVANQSPAVAATFKMLKKYNKYTDSSDSGNNNFIDTKGSTTPTDSLDADDKIKLSFQRGFGDYQIPNDTTSKEKSLRELSSIAHSMILKAAGWDDSLTAATSQNPDLLFDDVTVDSLSKFPIVNSLLNPDQVRPRESWGAPTNGASSFLANEGEALTKIATDAVYTKSSTNTNTPEVTFSRTERTNSSRPILRAYQAAISITSLAIIIEKTLNDKSRYFSDETLLASGLGPFYMGKSARSKADATLRSISDIAITNTGRFSYLSCVRAGLTLYFGIDANGDLNFGNNDVSSVLNFSSQIKQIAERGINSEVHERLAQSHGFWHAISRSCVRIITLFEKSLENEDSTLLANQIYDLLSSKALRVANVFAQIGYSYYIAHLESPTESTQASNNENGHLKSAFEVDSLESLPGTRVMKSRDTSGRSALSLAWRHSAVPSALLLPPSLIQASLDMDYIYEGPNPVKQMASTTLQDKTYVTIRNKGKIPIQVVNNLENRLDAEYVPFYFHDIRTNEMIGLHAFLDSLTDGYSVNFNSTQLHGRADTVKNYSNTKRNINFSFWLVATSQEDFDEMWAKINKIVTFAYPQYTGGVLNVSKDVTFNAIGGARDFVFEQPFSQVVGGSPILRLRIGDVIKSNYSRFNLSRLFGAGNTETGGTITSAAGFGAAVDSLQQVTDNQTLAKSNVFNNIALAGILSVLASPAELITLLPDPKSSGLGAQIAAAGTNLAYDALDLVLTNGFVNPLLPLIKNNWSPSLTALGTSTAGIDSIFGKLFLKPRSEPYEFISKADKNTKVYVKLTRPVQISIDSLIQNPQDVNTGPIKAKAKFADITLPMSDSFVFPVSNKDILLSDAVCDITLDECLFDPDSYYSITLASLFSVAGMISNIQGTLVSATSAATTSLLSSAGSPVDVSALGDIFGSLMRQFTSPLRNPITYAIEDNMSRGLAGVVTSIQFNWLDPSTVWETSWNSRAPMACKVTIAFDPIHDISPGLDQYGANRAPIYNVGATRLTSGDPHQDHGNKSHTAYTRSGAESSLKQYINQKMIK